MAKFENVSCSQCGKDFGPGDQGFSDCKHHLLRPTLVGDLEIWLSGIDEDLQKNVEHNGQRIAWSRQAKLLREAIDALQSMQARLEWEPYGF